MNDLILETISFVATSYKQDIRDRMTLINALLDFQASSEHLKSNSEPLPELKEV